MNYNLTELQCGAAKYIVEQVQKETLAETFRVYFSDYGLVAKSTADPDIEADWPSNFTLQTLDALSHVQMLRVERTTHVSEYGTPRDCRICTLTGLIYEAVSKNFREDSPPPPISAIGQPFPLEIAMSIERFRELHPDPKKVGFLIMRFAAEKPYAKILRVIKEVAAKKGLTILRADDVEYHADLLSNVRTYLHGCGFGIAVYDRIVTDEPNANIGLEVGYLLAMGKPVLLLKDKTVKVLHADLAGKLYKAFDPQDPAKTIPRQLVKWLEDYGILVRGA